MTQNANHLIIVPPSVGQLCVCAPRLEPFCQFWCLYDLRSLTFIHLKDEEQNQYKHNDNNYVFMFDVVVLQVKSKIQTLLIHQHAGLGWALFDALISSEQSSS